jgi:hypothetical protein
MNLVDRKGRARPYRAAEVEFARYAARSTGPLVVTASHYLRDLAIRSCEISLPGIDSAERGNAWPLQTSQEGLPGAFDTQGTHARIEC